MWCVDPPTVNRRAPRSAPAWRRQMGFTLAASHCVPREGHGLVSDWSVEAADGGTGERRRRKPEAAGGWVAEDVEAWRRRRGRRTLSPAQRPSPDVAHAGCTFHARSLISPSLPWWGKRIARQEEHSACGDTLAPGRVHMCSDGSLAGNMGPGRGRGQHDGRGRERVLRKGGAGGGGEQREGGAGVWCGRRG